MSQFNLPINYSPGTETVTVQYSTIHYELNGIGRLNWDTLYTAGGNIWYCSFIFLWW